MTIKYADRVAEITSTTGSGAYTMSGAQQGYQSFSAGIGDGQQTYYCVTNGTDWEVGLGTFTSAGASLSRDTILASSNSNLAVVWASGNKDAFTVQPAYASKIVELSNTGLRIEDTNSSHALTIQPTSDLTADRVLSIVTGDANRTLTLTGDASIAGTNTGDQTITLTGAITGSGTGSFDTDYNEVVPVAKGGTGQTGLGTANQLLGMLNSALGTEWKTLAAGANVTVTELDGVITIASTASGGGGGTGGLSAVRVYTGSDVWSKPVGLVRARVTVVGGGGGSNGAATTYASSGGGGGGASIKVIEAASLGATETVTVGSGGNAGVDPSWTPTAGGTSSFGSHCSATGGQINAGYTTSFNAAAGGTSDGGVGSGGQLNFSGGRGGQPTTGITGASTNGGDGGESLYAPRTRGGCGTNAADGAPVAGKFPGGGASGITAISPGIQRNGAAGGGGVVIVEEYI